MKSAITMLKMCLNRKAMLLAARGSVVCVAIISALIIDNLIYVPNLKRYIGTGATFADIWLLGELARYARPKSTPRIFAVAGCLLAVGFGLIVGFGQLRMGSYLSVSATCFLWGLGYWPKAKTVPIVAAPIPVPPPPPTTFGSAQWGTLDYMIEHRLVGDDGLMLGVIPGDEDPHRLRYAGDRHLLTIAPTGSGKGTTAIIPNLLTYRGSCLVVDPKGENALITARRRAAMGQRIHVVDPWGVAADAGHAARFNPLDWLEPGDIDIAENAMTLADALVVPDPKGEGFWTEEAKALLQGLILYVATDEDEADNRHLGRVRDLLLLDGEDMPRLFQRMVQSAHHVVASTGARSLQKEEKLLANVIASAQAQTSFLDSPRLRENLSRSDFKFEYLKAGLVTVYLVLPVDRLETFSRWLRLLIQQAITVTASDVARQPDKPVLFILDEMPSLGRLSMVKQAYGLMRGFGMQIWGIIQDAGQLKDIYGDSWEGFIANSGAVTYHGSRDNFSADYFSKLCGRATVLNFSSSSSFSSTYGTSTGYSSSSSGGSSSSASSASYTSGSTFSTALAQRKLAFPDELMRLGKRRQLVMIEHHHPILADKLPWFEDDGVRRLGRNLRQERLAAPSRGLPPRTADEWLALFKKAPAQ